MGRCVYLTISVTSRSAAFTAYISRSKWPTPAVRGGSSDGHTESGSRSGLCIPGSFPRFFTLPEQRKRSLTSQKVYWQLFISTFSDLTLSRKSHVKQFFFHSSVHVYSEFPAAPVGGDQRDSGWCRGLAQRTCQGLQMSGSPQRQWQILRVSVT